MNIKIANIYFLLFIIFISLIISQLFSVYNFNVEPMTDEINLAIIKSEIYPEVKAKEGQKDYSTDSQIIT